jgi:hypothetical protein
MSIPDTRSIAFQAAGIANAFRNCQINDHDGSARWEDLSETFHGWIGLVEQIVLAAEAMEHHRQSLGRTAAWGGELPHVYEVWDAIAKLLWDELPVSDMAGLISRAVQMAECTQPD